MNSTPASLDFSMPTLAIVGILAGLAILVFFIIALIKACKKKTAGWIITTILSGLLGFGALFGGAVAGSMKLIEVFAQLDKAEQTLTTKDGLFSIRVPKSWTVMPELNDEAEIGAGHAFREQYVMVITENKGSLNVDLPGYAKLVMDSMSGKQKNSTATAPTPLQIGTYPALRARIDGLVSGLRISYHCTFVETPDCVVQVLCWTLTDRAATGFPIFDKVAATFAEVAGARTSATASAAKPDLTDTTPTGRVRAILVEQLGVENAKVQPDARLIEDLGADNLDLVELVMAVEEEFEIEISDATAESWKKVSDIFQHVEKNAKAPASPPAPVAN